MTTPVSPRCRSVAVPVAGKAVQSSPTTTLTARKPARNTTDQDLSAGRCSTSGSRGMKQALENATGKTIRRSTRCSTISTSVLDKHSRTGFPTRFPGLRSQARPTSRRIPATSTVAGLAGKAPAAALRLPANSEPRTARRVGCFGAAGIQLPTQCGALNQLDSHLQYGAAGEDGQLLGVLRRQPAGHGSGARRRQLSRVGATGRATVAELSGAGMDDVDLSTSPASWVTRPPWTPALADLERAEDRATLDRQIRPGKWRLMLSHASAWAGCIARCRRNNLPVGTANGNSGAGAAGNDRSHPRVEPGDTRNRGTSPDHHQRGIRRAVRS